MGNVDPTHCPMAPMRYQITRNRSNIMALKAVLLAVLRFAGSWTPRTPLGISVTTLLMPK